MDSFTLNKIAGAVLGTCLFGMGIGIIADEIYKSPVPKKPGFALPEGKEGGAEGGGGAKSSEPTLPALLAKADPKKGEAAAKVCQACHNVEEGAGAKIGPDLYGVVDRPKGSVPGFDYSAGMKKKGGNWTFADLDTFLTKPSAYVQGTKMSYGGEGSAEKRADIIVYLRTLSKKPADLPKVAAADAKGSGTEAKKEGGGDQLISLIAASDPKKGESDAQICGACHNFKKGEGAKIGPDLYGVVDRPKGSAEGFDYSAGMKKKGGNWTFADLNTFLTKPSAYVQGTKMGFAGEASEKKRASIIAYLHTLADKPVPLPKAEEKRAAGDDKAGGDKKADAGKPAEGGAAAGGDFVKLVAAADGKKGESAAQICGACHNFKKGAGAKIGPDLYGVVDRPKGSAEGFDYSAGLKKKGGKWTYDDLNQFLTKPSAYVQGTKMGFAGEANEKKRALIVAYLRTLADTPAPLPGAGGDKPAPEKAAAKPEEKKPDEKKADAPPPPAKPATPAPEKKSDSQPQAPSEPPAKSEEKKPEDKKADAPPPAPPANKPDEKKADAPPPAAEPAKPAPEQKSDSQPQAPSEPAKAEEKPEDKTTDDTKSESKGGGPEPYSAPTPDEAK